MATTTTMSPQLLLLLQRQLGVTVLPLLQLLAMVCLISCNLLRLCAVFAKIAPVSSTLKLDAGDAGGYDGYFRRSAAAAAAAVAASGTLFYFGTTILCGKNCMQLTGSHRLTVWFSAGFTSKL